MAGEVVQLTATEKALLETIIFTPSLSAHDPAASRVSGDAALELVKSLAARQAIPEIRTKFFTDPGLNVGGRGKSRCDVFEKNGTKGDDIYRHPHFTKYLHYFLYGPALPAVVLESFQKSVTDCGEPVTSGDINSLEEQAKKLARLHGLDVGKAAEEFYKLALECGLDADDSCAIRNAVKRLR